MAISHIRCVMPAQRADRGTVVLFATEAVQSWKGSGCQHGGDIFAAGLGVETIGISKLGNVLNYPVL